MFERILVPLDGSSLAEGVLPYLIAISGNYHPEINLLRVLDPFSAATRPRSVDPINWQIRKAEAEAYLKEIALQLSIEGVECNIHVSEGKAADTAIDFIREHNIDLIVISSHGQSGLSGWSISSVVQKIILRARTSFLLVRAHQAARIADGQVQFTRILLPLDGSQRAESALHIGSMLAKQNDAVLLLAHVLQPPELPHRTPLSTNDLRLIEKVVERNRVEIMHYLEEMETRVDCQVASRFLISESVAVSLQKIIEQENIDLVILTAHGHSGEDRWPYGSTVVNLISYGSVPLLVFQDLLPENIKPTRAEIEAREHGGR
jgi:nucleotide-binding universal stress UspA family protein